jgi:hypothetical protein
MNPEKPVLDDIDELMAQECDEDGVPLDDYNNDRYDRCEMCHEDWHGLPYADCPGAYGMKQPKQPYIGYLTTQYQGQLCTVHLYADGRGGYVGLLSPGTDERDPRGLSSDLYTFDEAYATLTMHAAEGVSSLSIIQAPQQDSESDTL